MTSYIKRSRIMANYYKLRYTFPDEVQDEENKTVLMDRIKEFCRTELIEWITHFEAVDYSYGIEFKDKYGEPTKIHVHMHFASDKDIGGMRKWITRRWKEQGEERTRASLYSFVEEKDVKDEERFYRYPLKQYAGKFSSGLTHRMLVASISPEKHAELVALAHDEWTRLCEINIKKRDTQLNKDTTYQKIEKHLGQMDIKTYGQVKDELIKFYMKEGMAINVNTIAGYVVTYSLNRGFLDPSQISAKLDKIILG